MKLKRLTTKEKALEVNLDRQIYGSFAEIGAGQDTAAHFFKAGGASGTIAKTMSAYDMAFSDAIYGPETSGRYVCEPRLKKMLDKEYRLLDKRLPDKINNTRFFAFANTVEAINFHRTNEGRGWLGVRFQLSPGTPPNDCIIHVILKDNDNLQQQQVLGIVGVNLIYGCFYYHEDPDSLLQSLMDDLDTFRIEIDYFSLEGPNFEYLDHRLFSLKLVKSGMSKAALFGPDGEVYQPADALYKKNILILRGRFRPVTHVNIDMLEKGYEYFIKENDVDETKTIVLNELTLNNLSVGGDIDEKDFLDRVDILCSLGQTVLISNYHEYYRLVKYLSKFSKNQKMGLVLGVYNLASIFEEKYYEYIQGGILEAFGILFGRNVKLFIYPSFAQGTRSLMNSNDIDIAPHLEYLFKYLVDNNKIENITKVKEEHLHIISDLVLKMIKEGEEGWEEMVPLEVAEAIKRDVLFDYKSKINA